MNLLIRNLFRFPTILVNCRHKVNMSNEKKKTTHLKLTLGSNNKANNANENAINEDKEEKDYGSIPNISLVDDVPSSSSPKSTSPKSLTNNNGEILTNHVDGSAFSLKHFLNKDATSAAAAATTLTNNSSTTTTSGDSAQKQTGARPKVPLNIGFNSTTVKMKRSPKFSSFDSQASLAEYSSGGAASSSSTSLPTTTNDTEDSLRSNSIYTRSVYNDVGNGSAPLSSDKSAFQRSYSTYEMGRGNGGGNRRRYTHNSHTTPNLQQYDDMIELSTSPRPSGDGYSIVSPEVSSALPDFVKDHMQPDSFFNQYEQLPDFAINENDGYPRGAIGNNNGDNMPFDLMCSSSPDPSSRRYTEHHSRNPLILPLDLPFAANREQDDYNILLSGLSLIHI